MIPDAPPALATLHGPCPFTPPADPAAWRRRAAALRRQVRLALGLWPWPTRTPLQTVLRPRGMHDGVEIAGVRFASFPGFTVTGNLYRPAAACGPLAGVLSPHGHWNHPVEGAGRFMDHGDEGIARELASGAESDPAGGRNPIQTRCIHLARMGCAVLQIDMLGCAESRQIPYAVAHRFYRCADERRDTADAWHLFGATAEGLAQNVVGIQVWNAIRALDLLCTLPDVDPARIGVTGESGGATQTLLLGALDPRPRALFPAVMVSTGMQGGCTCENASLLRIGTGNVELAALAAPRALGLTTADDWTRTLPADGFPQLRRLYALLGAEDRLELHPFPQFPHNFNQPARQAMYCFMARHLGLGEPRPETRRRCLAAAELSAWDPHEPQPHGGEQTLLRWWADDARNRLAASPVAQAAGWRILLGIGAPAGIPAYAAEELGGGWRRLVADHPHAPACLAVGPPAAPVVVALVASLPTPARPPAWLARLLASGMQVWLPEPWLPGCAANPLVPSTEPRPVPGYTYGYNRPLFLLRLHRALLALRAAATPGPIALVGRDGGEALAAALRVLGGALVAQVRLEHASFRFAALADWRHTDFLPAALRLGDLPGLLACPGAPVRWGDPAGVSPPSPSPWR